MTIGNFSVSPALLAPGDEMTFAFTVKAESGDTIGTDGLLIWMSIPGYGETIACRDASFTISKGQSRDVRLKAALSTGSYSPARGSALSAFGVQLGSYGSRADVSFPLTLLDAWYRPGVQLFTAERVTGDAPDDEGESLRVTLALSASAAGRAAALPLTLSCRDASRPDAAPVAIDLGGLRTQALAGEAQAVVSGVFDKNADWSLTFTFGDACESAVSNTTLARAFANVHLSGASTGGVCFGSFSKATENKPLFQCYYPAEFEAGIRGVTNYAAAETDTGGTWLDGKKKVYRRVFKFSNVAIGSGTVTTALGAIDNFADIETMVEIRGTLHYGVEFYPLPRYWSETAGTYSLDVNNGTIRLRSIGGSSPVDVVVELLYTKTTEEVS